MVAPTDLFHGSDLEMIEERYNVNKQDLRPFAANVNPLGISPRLAEALKDNLDIISEYPDRDYKELREALSQYTEVSPAHILPSNGVTELISTFIGTVKPKKTIIIEPTYSEYRRDLKAVKSEVVDYVLDFQKDFSLDVDDLLSHVDEATDMIILCNPNNPTSSCVFSVDIKRILEHCKATHTFLMVDETYAEFAKDFTEITCVPFVEEYNNLIVLRGVSKFFAAPGLRLGYACTSNDKLLNYIRKHSNPWTVSSIAAYAGTVMFQDAAYIRRTRDAIATEQSLVCSALRTRQTVQIFYPKTNFILCKIRRTGLTAEDVFEHCIKKNLMIRDCSDFMGLDEHYFRFCFLKPEDDDLLVNTLLEIL